MLVQGGLKFPSSWLKVASCWLKLASCWLKLAQVGSSWPHVGSSWPHVGLMEASWSCWNLEKPVKTNGFSIFFKLLAVCFKWLQVGSSWPQVGSSWLQVGSSWTQDQLREPPGGSPGGSWEGPGRVLGGTWSQEALLEAPEVPKWPPGDSKIYEKSIKLISDLKALASERSKWSGISEVGSEGFSSLQIWDLRALASEWSKWSGILDLGSDALRALALESSKWSGILDLGSEWSSTDGGFSPHLYV